MKKIKEKINIKFTRQEKVMIVLLIISFLIITFENIKKGFELLIVEDLVTSTSSTVVFFTSIVVFVFLLSFYKRKYREVNKIDIALFTFSIYFFFLYVLDVNIISIRDYLKVFLLLFWVFCFKLGMNISQMEVKKLYKFFFYFTLYMILPIIIQSLYYFYQKDILSFQRIGNDAVFSIIVFFPFVLLLDKNKLFRAFLIILFLVISLLSFKRSIIISSFLMILIYLMLVSNIKDIIKKFFSWHFLIIAPILVYFYMNIWSLIRDVLFSRFESLSQDGGSGRDFIYTTLFAAFKNSKTTEMFFGQGYISTKNHVGILAHNDLLQILIDFGLIGLMLYLIFIFHLIKLIVVSFKNRVFYKNDYAVYVATLTYFLFLSQTNVFIYNPYLFAPLMFVIGTLYFKLNNIVTMRTIK